MLPLKKTNPERQCELFERGGSTARALRVGKRSKARGKCGESLFVFLRGCTFDSKGGGDLVARRLAPTRQHGFQRAQQEPLQKHGAPHTQAARPRSCPPHASPLPLRSTCAGTRCPCLRYQSSCPVRWHRQRASHRSLSRRLARTHTRLPASRPRSCGASGAAGPTAHPQKALEADARGAPMQEHVRRGR